MLSAHIPSSLSTAVATLLLLTLAAPVAAQDTPRRIYKEKGEMRSPAVSPSGELFVYSVWQEKRYAHKLRVLTIGKRVKGNDAGWGVGAAYSPDGAQLMYLSEAKGDGKYWITVADPKGRNGKDLGFEGSNPEGNPPSWSPDGKEILLINPAGTYLIPTSGEAGRRISVKTLGNASWSPDGEHIVYELKGGGVSKLTVASGATEAITRRSRGLAANWSPDGNNIAWIEEDQAVIFHVETGKRTTVGAAIRVVWTHNGGGLLLLTETGTFTDGATTPIPDMAVSWVGLDGTPGAPIELPKLHSAQTAGDGRTVFFTVHGDGVYRMRLPALEGAATPKEEPKKKGTLKLPVKRPDNRKIDADTLKAIQ
jgi:Tol biopolymer transport system component